jgi:hypothetical protein
MFSHPVTYLFRREVPILGTVKSSHPALNSHAFVCAGCGDVWARVVSQTSKHFVVTASPCELHSPSSVQDWSRLPGSILKTAMPAEFISVLDAAIALDKVPEAVLAREVRVHLAYFERTRNG